MKNDLKKIHLMQRLVERMNTEVFDMSYMLITTYLLRNFNNINDITIEELCNETYVSKSTIRRFCNNIGYKNFTELKKSYDDNNVEIDINIDFQASLPNIINEVFEIKDDIIKTIAFEISKYNHIFILHSYDLYSVFYEFQKEMLYREKVIHLMPNIDLHYQDTKDYLDKSLILIIDFDNYIYENAKQYLNGLNSKNIYLTNQEKEFCNPYLNIKFDYLPHKTLRKYQLMYFLDRVIQQYPENV